MYLVVETVDNPRPAEPLEVWFEPWGMPYTLAPGRSFRVVATSAVRGALEITRGESRVVVYAGSGATLQVWCDGQLVGDLSYKFPELPPGMSTRSFVGTMFGSPE